jgi:hypothetical protein
MIPTISDQSDAVGRGSHLDHIKDMGLNISDRSVENCESPKTFLSSTLGKALVADAKTIVLIPGSNRGIGFETAREIVQKGITVVVAGGSGNEGADSTRKVPTKGH